MSPKTQPWGVVCGEGVSSRQRDRKARERDVYKWIEQLKRIDNLIQKLGELHEMDHILGTVNSAMQLGVH